MTANQFGGRWTQDKLKVLQEYLDFYTKALKNQPFTLIYIDCFAGTGRVKLTGHDAIIDGSARIALNCEPGFDRYHFIESNRRHLAELQELVNGHRHKDRCTIAQGDAAKLLWPLLNSYKDRWRDTRGVLFLDPFGLQCTWDMLQDIAATKALDVFFWVSLSGLYRQAALKANDIDKHKAARLTRFLGTDGWLRALYAPDKQADLFSERAVVREQGWRPILSFVTKRLGQAFPYVSQAYPMGASNNAPLYALFFCCANPSGPAKALASRVSSEILGKLPVLR